MGLKCSVLGHKFGDATVERDREEQGSEVVITIREIEACRRCEEERVVSENKEVTTLETPDEPASASDERADEPEETESDETEPVTDAEDVTSDSVAVADDDDDHEDAVEASGSADDEFDGPVDAKDGTAVGETSVDATEGAEILEAEADEDVVDDELADPSIEETGIGSDPVEEEPIEDDAVFIDEDDESDVGDGGREPGAWPEEPADDRDDAWAPSDALDEEKPITAPDAGTENNAAVTIPDGQFRCPQCGYTTLVEDSSLRAGDFCPDCRKGSLVHEPRDETRKE